METELPGESSLRSKLNQKFLFHDTETCNVNLTDQENLPWNVAGIITRGQKIIKEFDYFPFFPDLNVSKGAVEKTRFDWNEYKEKGIDPVEAYNEFSFIYDDPDVIVVGQNSLNFDIYIINNWRRKIGIKNWRDFSHIKQGRFIDTNCLSKAYEMGLTPPKYGTAEFMFWQFKMIEEHSRKMKTSLASMCKKLDIKIDESLTHRGNYDCLLTKELFFKLMYLLKL